MSTSKGDLLKKHSFSLGKIILKVLGLEVGTKNRSKINKKTERKMEGSQNRFFIDFGGFGRPSWGSQNGQKKVQEGIRKMMQKSRRLEGVLGRKSRRDAHQAGATE